jgi:hypothetical protein
MIADHTIISARAEKSQRVPAQRLLRRVLTPSMAAAVAGSLGIGSCGGQTCFGRRLRKEDRPSADSPSRVDAMDEMERRPQRAEGRYADAAAEAVILARAGTTRATVGRLLTPDHREGQRLADILAARRKLDGPPRHSDEDKAALAGGDLAQRGGSSARYAEQQLFERLDRKPGEREEIERLLDQVNKALDLLDPGDGSPVPSFGKLMVSIAAGGSVREPTIALAVCAASAMGPVHGKHEDQFAPASRFNQQGRADLSRVLDPRGFRAMPSWRVAGGSQAARVLFERGQGPAA